MKALTNWRFYVIAICYTVGIVTFLSSPNENSTSWVFDFLAAKLISIAAFIIAAGLIKFWGKKHKIDFIDDILK